MSVSFFPSQPNVIGICGICLEQLGNDAMTHDMLHHIHRKCLKIWAKKHLICPYCKQKIDPSSLFSWKEKMVNWIQNIDISKASLGFARSLDDLLPITASFVGARAAVMTLEIKKITEQMCPANPVSYAVITMATIAGVVAASRFEAIEKPQVAMITAITTTFLLSANYDFILNHI